jgi:hypothetical protein
MVFEVGACPIGERTRGSRPMFAVTRAPSDAVVNPAIDGSNAPFAARNAAWVRLPLIWMEGLRLVTYWVQDAESRPEVSSKRSYQTAPPTTVEGVKSDRMYRRSSRVGGSS